MWRFTANLWAAIHVVQKQTPSGLIVKPGCTSLTVVFGRSGLCKHAAIPWQPNMILYCLDVVSISIPRALFASARSGALTNVQANSDNSQVLCVESQYLLPLPVSDAVPFSIVDRRADFQPAYIPGRCAFRGAGEYQSYHGNTRSKGHANASAGCGTLRQLWPRAGCRASDGGPLFRRYNLHGTVKVLSLYSCLFMLEHIWDGQDR